MGARMQPIRDMAQVDDIQVTLSRLDTTRGKRMFLLFEVGIRMGLRIGDMLQLRVGDLRGKMSYTYRPAKQQHKNHGRGIELTATIEPALRKIIAARTAGMEDGDLLFPSQKHTAGGNARPITRQQAYRDMRLMGEVCKAGDLGCHTLRKTFGYHHYRKHKDIAFLQGWFGHSDPSTTLIYIGITEDEARKRTDNTPFALPDQVAL